MSTIRIIKNVQLTVINKDGIERNDVFAFGDIHKTSQIQIIDDQYVTIVFANGDILEGINKNIFENYGTPIITIPTSNTFINPEVTPPDDEEDDTIIPLEGTMLDSNDDEE